MKRAIFAGVLACFAFIGESQAQTWNHRDYGGYTYRSPSTDYTYSYRYDNGATYQKYGNYSTYSDNTGTTGSSFYGPSQRFDYYSNPSEGWTGSGSTYYYKPRYSGYRRYRY